MIIVKASSGLPRIYAGEAFVQRRYIFKCFSDMRKAFDKMLNDEWYGFMMINIIEIIGASYDDLKQNEDWLSERQYHFYEVE